MSDTPQLEIGKPVRIKGMGGEMFGFVKQAMRHFDDESGDSIQVEIVLTPDPRPEGHPNCRRYTEPGVYIDGVAVGAWKSIINEEDNMKKYEAIIIRDKATRSAKIHLKLTEPSADGNEQFIVPDVSNLSGGRVVEREEGGEMPLWASIPNEKFIPILLASQSEYRNVERDTYA